MNRTVPLLMALFVFLNPVPHTTAIKEICFYGSLGIVLILWGFKKIDFSFRSPLTLPFGLFTLWAFIGLFFALDKENSIHDFQTHWLKYLAFYYILINVFNTRERLAWLAWAVMVPAALVSLGVMVHFYGILAYPLSARLATGIPEIAVNGLGIIAIPAALFALHHIIAENRLAMRILSCLCLFPTITLCFLTQAKGTLLALSLGIIIFFFNYKKILLACLIVILAIVALTPIKERFVNVDPINALRLDIHYITYEIIKDYPVFGIGFGMQTYGNRKFIDLESYSRRIPEKYRGYLLYTDPHSIPFSIAVRTGLMGLVLFLYLLIVPFMMAWQCLRGKDGHIEMMARCVMAALAAVLFIGFFEPFFSHVPEIVFYTLLAMMTIVCKLREQDGARQ